MAGSAFKPTVLCVLLPLLSTVEAAFGGSAQEARRSPYIGAQACGECHQDKFEGFRQTAHHLTSRLSDGGSVAGKFTLEHAVLQTRNSDLWFEMSARDGGFFQTAVIRDNGEIRRRTEQIDVVIGSGKIGQTYLFWQGNRLFQLPVSYLARTDRWINSPGYRDGEANFNRPVFPRCLECHATYFEAVSYYSNTYNRDHFVLGVSCERCHGPGADHAEHPSARSDAAGAPSIVHPGKLDSQRQIEICAQCHAGLGVVHKPPFSFRPGKPLNEYIELEDYGRQNSVGVHSTNQIPRLSRSNCFQESKTMTCVSCHNPHAPERGKLALFSERCIACHEPRVCGMAQELGDAIRHNCIDCHMPQQHDRDTVIETDEGIEFPLMRDHFIAVYPEATRRFMKQFSRTGGAPRAEPQPQHGRR